MQSRLPFLHPCQHSHRPLSDFIFEKVSFSSFFPFLRNYKAKKNTDNQANNINTRTNVFTFLYCFSIFSNSVIFLLAAFNFSLSSCTIQYKWVHWKHLDTIEQVKITSTSVFGVVMYLSKNVFFTGWNKHPLLHDNRHFWAGQCQQQIDHCNINSFFQVWHNIFIPFAQSPQWNRRENYAIHYSVWK